MHLEAIAVNPHHAVKGALHTGERDNCKASKTKQIHQSGSRSISSGQINSLVHSKKNALELSNIKRPGRPRRTTVVDDLRIFSMVKKNPFTTSSQEKNTIQEADVSLSKSTIKRRLHQSNCRGFTTRCKQGQIRLCQKHLKMPDQFLKIILWTVKIKTTCTRMTGRKKSWNSSWSKAHNIICETWWMMEWACMASSGTGLLVFSDNVTEDRSSRMNSEVYWDIYSLSRFSQIQQSSLEWRFTVQVEMTQTYSKRNPGVFEGKKVEYFAMAKSISWSQPDWACFSLAKDTEKRQTERPTNKQQTSQRRKPSLWWCLWVTDLRQSLPANDSQQNITNEHFIYNYMYFSNYIWALNKKL